MAKINNYPYTNMVYQNVDWITDEVKEAKETSERAEQTVQEMDSRVSTLEIDMRNAESQLAAHEVTINQNSTEISALRNSLSNVSGKVTDLDAQLPVVRSIAVSAEEKGNALETSKVDKTNNGNRVYGTNGSGEQSTYTVDVNNELTPASVVVRAENGTIKTSAPVLHNDATNKQYVDEAVANYIWDTAIDDTIATALDTNTKTYDVIISDCKELKITTIIDSGATNPTLYDSENLEVSINDGSFFSVDGGVPNASSSREETEEFANMYTWDWSSFGFGEQKAQILTKKKFTTIESLTAANVSITSYLSSDTYEVISVDPTPTSADTPGYKGYKVTFQKTGDPTTLRYGVLTTQVESAAPDLQVGMLCICSFDAGGDISDLFSGKWMYTDTVALHKIATGNLDMKFINADMAETETSGSGNRDAIDNGTIIPAANIKHYALHRTDNSIRSVQVKVSNGVIREGTRVIIQYHK